MQLTRTNSFFLLLGIMAIIFYGLFGLKAEPHLPLLSSLIVLALFARVKGMKWDELEEGILDGLRQSLKPIIILALIGMLIATWMVSGTIPTVLYYGIQWIDPTFVLMSSLFITTLTSILTGSSFTAVSTVGVAMMGIALAFDIHPALAAGAIICGAMFGDKMSPLSDTTNFASGIASVDIITHIRHMIGTTIPSYALTCILFFLFEKNVSSAGTIKELESIVTALEQQFHIHLLTLLPPMLLIILAIRRTPTVISLFAGIFAGIIVAFLTQANVSLAGMMTILQHGPTFETGNALVDKIVNRGGLQSMMWAISLIMIAFSLSGVMNKIGLIEALLSNLAKKVRSRGHLVSATAASSIGVNLLTGEQYLSILLPGQSFRTLYENMNVERKTLARTLEDAGTLINPLVPWGVCGAFFASTLGVDVIEYIPYTFFLYLSPLFSILFAYLPMKNITKQGTSTNTAA
ncbi:Na+/H+ antiporter NhaC [Bacillus alveayuensis]|jgi:Na+:H+ antiporter, NhaC family|uniref:Na+/H+ antiporter NhaC n=1 Tax=Aeribacillus alveayuensis TaxID=279215 RepID=UPI0005CDBC2A|nr:Na+/H+ antiporter NhaC [Bacillus alveayuensis]